LGSRSTLLAFSIKAAGAHVPWWGIVLAWAAGAGGASLNLTPGGLGVVEVALTGALVAVGVPSTSRFQSLQRSRKVIPARRAMRSSSLGQTYRNGAEKVSSSPPSTQ